MVSGFAANVSDADGTPLRVVNATACAGDSDEPMPSTIPSTDGSAAIRPSFTSPDMMLPPDPSSRSDERSQRSGSATIASSIGRALASPTRLHALTRSRAMRSRTRSMCTWGSPYSTTLPPPSRVPKADHWPLACISGPSASETNCSTVSPGGRNGRRRCAGLSSTDAAICSGAVIGGPPGFPLPRPPKNMSSWRHTTPFGRPVVPPV
jgi:hypothetical protein